MTQDSALQTTLIAALILLNAFFAAAELAIVSMRRSRIRQLVEEARDDRAAAVARLVEQPGRFLATIQIGTTLTGFFASAVGAVSLVAILAAWLGTIPLPVIAANAYGTAFVAVTLTISLVTLVLGELAPKNLAIVHAEAIALRVARPVELLSKLAAPLVWSLATSTSLLIRLAGVPERARVPPISAEEILAMVASGEDEGVVAPAERKLIGEVFEFGQITADEVMVPRVDVRALPAEATLAEARQLVIASGHTRLPVYEGSLDNIIGVVHAKDVLEQLDPRTFAERAAQSVTGIMRTAYHVPASKRAADLLAELQQQQLHLAVVVDEYGGTAGIVSLDNILEELVGPIRDEYDAREEPEIELVGERQAVVSGGAALDDVGAALGIELAVEGVDTMGGLVYAKLGRIPRDGDLVEMPDAILEVLSMRGRRVWKVQLTRRGKREEVHSPSS
jgi:putative hemolysin